MGGAYEFFRTAAANLREKNDSYNEAIGGFCSGAMLGVRCQLRPCQTRSSPIDPDAVRTIPSVLGYGAGLSIVMAAFDYTGGSFLGYGTDPTVDEYERKEALRANKRRPIAETLQELGEGRGPYPSALALVKS